MSDVSCGILRDRPDTIQTAEDSRIGAFFGRRHILIYKCTNGHELIEEGCPPITEFSLLPHDISLARAQVNKDDIDLAEYFSHAIPRRPIGNDSHGTTMLHTLKLRPCESCRQQGRDKNMLLDTIQTTWPQVLRLIPETRADTPEIFESRHPVKFPLEWMLESSGEGQDAGQSYVCYRLVGRIHFKNAHFTAQIHIGDSAYLYDSIEFRDDPKELLGKLTRIAEQSVLEAPSREVSLVIYHRTSTSYNTERRVSDIEQAYNAWRELHPPTPVISLMDSESVTSSLPATPTPQPRKIRTIPLARKSNRIAAKQLTQPPQVTKPQRKPSQRDEQRKRAHQGQASSSETHLIHCAGCELESSVDANADCGEEMIECDSCSCWHHIPCIEVQFGNLPPELKYWSCPRCAGKPLWKDD